MFQKAVKRCVLILISTYQYSISPVIGSNCRFYPTCSNYAAQAIIKYGTFKGTCLAIKRLLKCHPFHPGGYDPVP